MFHCVKIIITYVKCWTDSKFKAFLRSIGYVQEWMEEKVEWKMIHNT